MGPRAVFNAVVKRKIPTPRWEWNPKPGRPEGSYTFFTCTELKIKCLGKNFNCDYPGDQGIDAPQERISASASSLLRQVDFCLFANYRHRRRYDYGSEYVLNGMGIGPKATSVSEAS
jgi:hypothetical protein